MTKIKGLLGSYTKNDGKGIYTFEIDTDLKKITSVETGYEVGDRLTFKSMKINYMALKRRTRCRDSKLPDR